jgi:aminoglycoside phosphotransferase (APT) family kinase protein
MHADEVDTDADLVARLVAAQFPHWADLPIRPVPSAGTDNALYRLGGDLVARLPRIHWAVEQVATEQRWLPRLAPHLPLAIPTPVARGQPGQEFPWPWSVYRWLDGESETPRRGADLERMAADLARFIIALQRIDTQAGPVPGAHSASRGQPLATRDASTRAAIAAVRDTFDAGALSTAWDAALHAPIWFRPPVWIHGDLKPGNFLYRAGRLSAVIDFGCLSVGDPACDLQVAWNLFDAEARAIFREALAVDDATWARGRGWALSVGLIALPYYRETNPELAAIARRAIAEVLADARA